MRTGSDFKALREIVEGEGFVLEIEKGEVEGKAAVLVNLDDPEDFQVRVMKIYFCARWVREHSVRQFWLMIMKNWREHVAESEEMEG